jgi:hypothetical protein
MELLTQFVEWAWARHYNVLSWYIRPLFLLPFCYFAYKRNIWGIIITLIALATSMFWFPAPETPSAGVIEMLNAERDYLLGDLTFWKIVVGIYMPLTFYLLALAFWKRSLRYGLVVINAMLIFKIIWTFIVSDAEGALAHLIPSVIGLIICNAVIIFIIQRNSRKQSQKNVEAQSWEGKMAE